ncbi:MAG: shikimate kinase [Saprospiraceae bacterium]
MKQNTTTLVFLIGFMGSGKSTLGPFLAKELDYEFLDLDEAIEQGERQSIDSIFKSQGETGFRILESAYLKRTGLLSHTVVACGGGAPCFFDNLDWMKQHGKVVYLEAGPKVLAERLQQATTIRPIVRAVEPDELFSFVATKLRERNPFTNKPIQSSMQSRMKRLRS